MATNNDSFFPSQLTPTNFDIIQANRLSPSCGVGLSILYSSEFKLLSSSILSTISCEILRCNFLLPNSIHLFIFHHHHYLTTFYLNLNPFLNKSRQII